MRHLGYKSESFHLLPVLVPDDVRVVHLITGIGCWIQVENVTMFVKRRMAIEKNKAALPVVTPGKISPAAGRKRGPIGRTGGDPQVFPLRGGHLPRGTEDGLGEQHVRRRVAK